MTGEGVLAGLLVVAAATRLRVRPDHRLRLLNDGPDPSAPLRRRSAARGRSWRRVRRRPPGPADLAGWCDVLARDLRSGATLGFALRSRPAPPDSVFSDLPQRLGRGVPIATAAGADGGTADEQAVGTVLVACATAGGPAAEPLDRVASTLRRRAADEAERLVQSAQARLSARVMTVIPLLVLLILLLTSTTVRGSLVTPMGAITVVVGLLLNVIGWRWMRAVIGGRR
ncbi:MAG: type II secretion system F family protein [Ilumatobacteraceae bacterium]